MILLKMENNKKIKCSVAILTFNSGPVLRKALESVKDFDDIIICDSGSTDDTLDVAKEYGTQIIFQDVRFKNEDGTLKDFSGVRNQTLDAAKHDWFFFLDSDEYLDEKIVKEIEGIVLSTSPAAYWVLRKYVLDGEVVDCATTYPNRQMRFFNKKIAKSFIKKVHERIQLNADTAVYCLNEHMYVPLESDIKTLRKKWGRYINIECERMGSITFWQWLKIVFMNLKVSILYVFRLFKNMFFCKGNKMPLVFEMERHAYHFKLSIGLIKNIKI